MAPIEARNSDILRIPSYLTDEEMEIDEDGVPRLDNEVVEESHAHQVLIDSQMFDEYDDELLQTGGGQNLGGHDILEYDSERSSMSGPVR